MTTVADLVNQLGGLARKRQLVMRGADDEHLTYAVKTGNVTRVRNGWYTTWSEDDPRVRAVRIGGRLTGVSAVAERGGWHLGESPLHVSVYENAARLRMDTDRFARFDPTAASNVVLHWDPPTVRARGSFHSVHVVDALTRVVLDERFEVAVGALDWARRHGVLGRRGLDALLLGVPADRRDIVSWVDPLCDSLPESLARTRLRWAGHAVESQVPIPNGQRIDLLVDGVVALEVDGKEHHADRFEYDRRKDAAITVLGYHALRVSAATIYYDWPLASSSIDAALAQHPDAPGNSGLEAHRRRRTRGISGWF